MGPQSRLILAVSSLTLAYITLAVAENTNSVAEKSNQAVNEENSWRTKRDTDPELDEETLYNALNNLRAASLSKRSPRYMFGKRPRNNFLGKRSENGGDIPLIDFLQEEEEEKRGRRYPFLGKRSYLSFDDGSYFETDDDALEADKRGRRPFLGKRLRPMLGKRAKPFLGKRDFEQDDADMLFDGYENEVDKRRRMPFLGKRALRPMLGKRDFEGEDVKRPARYMLGKRDTELESARR